MTRHSIARKKVKDVIQCFHWFYKRDLVRWFPEHERRIDSVLREFLVEKSVRAIRWGLPKVYAAARLTKHGKINKVLIPHGLASTYCLVRIVTEHHERESLKIFPEKEFNEFKRRPEWGILSPVRTLLLLEFCTRNNFKRKWNMDGKVKTYPKILPDICRKFGAKEAVVLFICDVTRDEVVNYVGSLNGISAPSASLRYQGGYSPLAPFLFTDYGTFKTKTHEKIYIWAVDSTENEFV